MYYIYQWRGKGGAGGMAPNENVGVARVWFAPPPNIKVVDRLAPPPQWGT